MDKWQVDDYMNTHPVWSRYWPAEPCLLCRGFWIGCLAFVMLQLLPETVYVLLPLAAVPIQVILTKLLTRHK